MIRFLKRRTPKEYERLVAEYAKRRAHEDKALKTFGERVLYDLHFVAKEARVYTLEQRIRRVAEARLEAAGFVADHLQQALKVRLLPASDDVFDTDDVWRRVPPLLSEALALVKEHAATVRGFLQARASEPPAPRGRPSSRRRFIELAREKCPETRKATAGAWAHISIAVGLDDPGEDFEQLRKTYADLLGARRGPGKTPRRKKSTPREKQRAQ